jgi:hypothetical protein
MLYLRLLFAILILVIGTLLGDGYKNNLYLFWLLSSALLVIYSEAITNKLVDVKNELETYKEKVTTLTILKGNSGNVIQMAVYPFSTVTVNREVRIDVFVTSAVSITDIPDLKLRTKDPWEVKISNQPQISKRFAGKYEYLLSNPVVNRIDDKYLKYSFFVKISTVGNHSFSLEIDNGSITGEIHNEITVH